MITSEFLEDYPLFRKLNVSVPEALNSFNKPSIHMKCLNCKSDQTFTMMNDYFERNGMPGVPTPSRGANVKLIYLCQACRQFNRFFYLYISPGLDYIYKVGQFPEWEIKIDKRVEQILGNHVSFFRKGLVCESQSYGIGAFAYYRRITEEIIDELLDSISELIEPENLARYQTALAATKKTRITQDKIDLVKELLPSILRPNGWNPLGVLHSELSDGLHGQSDEVCLDKAEQIRMILTFLVIQILQTKESGKLFTDSMRKLLDKKSDQTKK